MTNKAQGFVGQKDSTNSQTVDRIIEKLPLTKTHYYIVIAAALGFMFDSFDTYVVSYAMPSIIQEWNIDPVTNGVLSSLGIWGMFIGAFLWGPITDKYGRKVGFIGTILGFALLTGFTVLATNPTQFGIMRFVTGLFLGGMIPVDTALTSEYVSTKYRGRFTSLLTVLWPVGMLIAALLSLSFVSDYGWRILFLVGVVPAFLSYFIRRHVPESPRWLASKGRGKETAKVLKQLGATDEDVKGITEKPVIDKKASFFVLLQKEYIKRFVLTAGFYFFSYFGYYGFLLWLPTILSTVYGLDLAKTFTYTVMVAIFAILGRMTAYWTIERFGRKQLFYVGFGIGGIAAILFGLIENHTLLLVGACLLSFLYEQGVAGTVVYTAELYPSSIRATATSWSTAAGRISAAVSPVVFGYFMSIDFYYGIYITMAVFFWVAVALVYFLGVETKGQSLRNVGSA